jgi:hypothetical protein
LLVSVALFKESFAALAVESMLAFALSAVLFIEESMAVEVESIFASGVDALLLQATNAAEIAKTSTSFFMRMFLCLMNDLVFIPRSTKGNPGHIEIFKKRFSGYYLLIWVLNNDWE